MDCPSCGNLQLSLSLEHQLPAIVCDPPISCVQANQNQARSQSSSRSRY
jgi:hypothetical protein